MHNIQHDVVSLLYSIKGRIETHFCKFESSGQVSSGTALPEAHDAMRKVYAQAQKALDMTRRSAQIMAAKPDHSAGEASTRLQDAWDRALALLREKYSVRQIDFVEHIPADYPLLSCRHEDLAEIFYYLVDNSFQALNGQGCIIIRASIVYDGEHPAKASIVIADTGAGITAEVMPNLFRPFMTTKAPSQGNGLGLCLVRGLMRRNGGQVALSSFEGFGTSVTLLLPLALG